MKAIQTDIQYMEMALCLAEKARGRTSPNPLVGAVLVKDGRVVGAGFHRRAGLPHAEVEALKEAGGDARGAHLYLNLEPCSHTGRTPPCCDALIQAGIKKVTAAMLDPNPLVSGKGMEKLRAAGIEVDTGLLEKEARRLNEIFVKYITTLHPFVILKCAASLDGKIALADGHSQWITGEESRRRVHEIRDEVDAVLVGVNTVIRDDPRLTTRLDGRETLDPARVILDSSLRVPENARILQGADRTKIFIATAQKADREKVGRLEAKGITVLFPGKKEAGVDLHALMDLLGERGITSLLVEGGSQVNASVLKAGIADKAIFFFAPKIIGGVDSLPIFGREGVKDLDQAVRLKDMEISRAGEDIMMVGYF